MSDISALEGRITAALERISAGLDGMSGAASVGVGDSAALQAQLQDERTANAQLVERAAGIIENLGAKVIGPAEVRAKLGLTKRAPVAK